MAKAVRWLHEHDARPSGEEAPAATSSQPAASHARLRASSCSLSHEEDKCGECK